MSGLVPFNRRSGGLSRSASGFEDFYNILDDFFSDGLLSGRSLLRDTFKIDIAEKEDEYLVEAELPGVGKDEIELNVDDEILSISVNRSEDVNKDGKSYVHRERRASSMTRRIRLAGARPEDVSAKLENGVLAITLPKDKKISGARKIDIG